MRAWVNDVVRVAREHGIDVKYLFITHYHINHVKHTHDVEVQGGA